MEKISIELTAAQFEFLARILERAQINGIASAKMLLELVESLGLKIVEKKADIKENKKEVSKEDKK